VAQLIGVHPVIGSPIDEISRRVVLVRFPFSVMSCAEKDKLLIVAVFHQRHKPRYCHGSVGR
jgi:hypothetical protein